MADKTTNLQLQKIDNTDYAGNFPTIYNNNLDLIDVLNNKQDKLIAGSGITIAADGKTISAETEKPWKVIKNLEEIKSLFTLNFGVTNSMKTKSYTINKRFYVEIVSVNKKDNNTYSTYYRSNIFEKITHKVAAAYGTYYTSPVGMKMYEFGNQTPSVDIGFNTNSTLTDYNFEIRMSGTGNASGTVSIGNLIKVNNNATTILVEDILSYGTVNSIGSLYFSIKYQD